MSTAYVLNCLEPTTLYFDGRPWEIPFNRVIKFDDQVFRAPDEYKRNHPSDRDANAMLESHVDGMSFARNLLNRQYLNLLDAGFWLGEAQPTDEQRKATKMKAEEYKRRAIDLALQERRERQAGGMGRLSFDEKIILWMQELGIEDELYNPDAGDQRMAKTLAKALYDVMQQNKEPEAAGKAK
jgi:hypothetical protein